MATIARASTSPTMQSLDFAITGKVQGVYFRKSTQSRAVELGITGWVANDPMRKDLVIGHTEGEATAMTEMKYWLSKVGSATCRIDSAAFTKEQLIVRRSHATFEVRKLAKPVSSKKK